MANRNPLPSDSYRWSWTFLFFSWLIILSPLVLGSLWRNPSMAIHVAVLAVFIVPTSVFAIFAHRGMRGRRSGEASFIRIVAFLTVLVALSPLISILIFYIAARLL